MLWCYVTVTIKTSFSLWLQVFFSVLSESQVEQHSLTGRSSQSLHSFPKLFVIAPNCQGTTKNWCYSHLTNQPPLSDLDTSQLFPSSCLWSVGVQEGTAGPFYLYHDKIGLRHWITQHYYAFLICCKKYLIDISFFPFLYKLVMPVRLSFLVLFKITIFLILKMVS